MRRSLDSIGFLIPDEYSRENSFSFSPNAVVVLGLIKLIDTKQGFHWLLILLLTLSFVTQVSFAQSVTESSKKASSDVVSRLASGKFQDLIVVFDDSAAQNETKKRIAATGVTSSHKSILDFKVGQFYDKKREVLSVLDSNERTILREYSHLPISFVRFHSKKALDRLLSDPNVVAVYEDKVAHRAMLAQSLPLIGQPKAAAAGDLGSNTTVAVLDQRVDYTNPAFGSCTSPGVPSGCKVLVAQDAPGMKNDGLGFQNGHGTNVAATVLAVAPGSQIISLNVFNGVNANYTDVISAINWCIQNATKYNIVAINLSLGSGADTSAVTTANTNSSAYYTAFANARSQGILPIAAAGNDGNKYAISEPASVVGAVSVGAVYDSTFGLFPWQETPTCTDASTSADQVTCFSNSSSFLTLLAPGCRDEAGMASGRYFCGTSQAAPHVAGAVAVLRSAFPLETLDQTVARLTNGVPVTDPRNGITKPRLSLPMALSLPSCSYAVSPASISGNASGTHSSSITVTTSAGCSWTASDDANWITIESGTSGSGSGTVQYSVDPNNASTSRLGTITVADKKITVTQAGGGGSLSSLSNIWLVGSYSFQEIGTSVTMNVAQLANYRNSSTGTLRLELWATPVPYSLGVTGWRVATWQISIPASPQGVLGPRQSFYNLSATVPEVVSKLTPGTYYISLQVTEYDSINCSSIDHFCIDTFGRFPNPIYIPDVTPPTIPTGLTATPRSSAQVDLAWNASSDDVGVAAYKVFNNGTLLGRVTAAGTPVINLSPATSYQFTVSACDAAGNCSAQSTVASATTRTANSIGLVQGWNLVGNSVEAPITVANTFSDSSKVTSVWKWIPGSAKWAFYTPAQTDGGAAYASSKGYNILTTINAGEGFWVNTTAAFSVPLPSGTAVQSSSFKPATSSPAAAGGTHALPSGWSLIAAGDNLTPTQFDAAIATAVSTPPTAGQVYNNLTTLWAWDATKQNWYFWAPALFNSGGLSSYISSKNYLDSATMPTTPTGTLSPTTGFWVNIP